MDMDSSTLVEIVPEVASQIDSPAAEEAFLTHENDKHQPGKAKKKPIPKSKPRKKITITRDPEPEPEVLLVDDPVMPVAPRLPVARVKGFMKMSLDGKNTSADATYLMTKATELFIQQLGEKSWSFTEPTRRKTMSVQDMRLVIDSEENLSFLEDML